MTCYYTNWTNIARVWIVAAGLPAAMAVSVDSTDRLRVILETDACGDSDDEQSLVRFLLYANEWDTEGIIANRPQARAGENQNPQRTGLSIVRRQLTAYGQRWTNLVRHDMRYPPLGYLWPRTVAGYDNTSDAVNLIIAAVDRPDPRPIWYSDWCTSSAGDIATSVLYPCPGTRLTV